MEMGYLPDISVSCAHVSVHALALFVFQAMSSSWQNPMSQVCHSRYAWEGSCSGERRVLRLGSISNESLIPSLFKSISESPCDGNKDVLSFSQLWPLIGRIPDGIQDANARWECCSQGRVWDDGQQARFTLPQLRHQCSQTQPLLKYYLKK